MTIVVAILLVAGGVLTAFFYPRNVDVSILSINASTDYIIGTLAALSKNNTDTAILEMEVQIIVFSKSLCDLLYMYVYICGDFFVHFVSFSW